MKTLLRAQTNDMVTIIDTFIKKHPDFSYGGSKGVIAETGYNGVLGYRSSKSQYGDTKKTHREAKKATKVANAMKKEGWQFASHSWGHIKKLLTKDACVGSIIKK